VCVTVVGHSVIQTHVGPSEGRNLFLATDENGNKVKMYLCRRTTVQTTEKPNSDAMAKLHPVQHHVKYSSALFMVQISHSVEYLT
jgi:hypothetical protein